MKFKIERALVLVFIILFIYLACRKSINQTNYRKGGKLNSKQQIAIVAKYGNYEKKTLQNYYDYASKHGYKLVIADEHFPNQISMDKFEVIDRIFLEYSSINWLFWISPDSFFLNHKVKIESLLDDRFDLIVPISPLGEIQNMIQTDNFIIRNSEIGNLILKEIIKNKNRHCGHFIIDYPRAALSIDGWLNVCQDNGSFWNDEIGIIMGLSLYTKFKCMIRKVSERRFSSRFPRFSDGDFILSFAEELSLPMKKVLLQGALKFSDVSEGKIDRERTNALQPEENLPDIVDDDSNLKGCHYDEELDNLLNVTQRFIIEPTNEDY
jgi:hypothetical protein